MADRTRSGGKKVAPLRPARKQEFVIEGEEEESSEAVEAGPVDVEAIGESGKEKPAARRKAPAKAAPPSKIAKPARSAAAPPPRRGWVKFAAVGIVIVLLIVVVGFLFTNAGAPSAKINTPGTDINSVQAGRSVSFDGSGSSPGPMGGKPIDKYSWDFGDGLKATGSMVSHSFSQKGDYTVRLTVTDSGGQTGSASLKLHVVGTVVTIPMAMLGDTITYDVQGAFDISNPNGVWTYTYTQKIGLINVVVTATVTKAHMTIDHNQNPEMTVTISQSSAEDGFAQTHQCVDSKTTQTLPLTGYADVTLKPQSGLQSNINQAISGNANAKEHAFSDLNSNKTVKTTRSDNYNIGLGASGTAGSFQKTGNDNSTSYPKDRQDFNVDALRANRTFRTGDSGSTTFGGTTLLWTVVGEDNINGIQCLQIRITMDDNMMAKNGLTAFELDTWVSGSISLPLKFTLNTTGLQQGNTVVVQYSSTYTSFVPGTTNIPYGTSGGPYITRMPIDYFATPDTYGPAMGGNSPTLANYPLPEAVNTVTANSQGLKTYLASNQGAFLVNAQFNNTGTPVWDLTFGTTNSSSAYEVIVLKGGSITSQNSVTISKVTRSIKDYNPALTFTGAEQVFKGKSEIASVVYQGDQINTGAFNFGSKADVPVPTSGLPISTNIFSSSTDYYFYVEARDGSFSAGADSETGQVMFFSTHSGN